MSYQLYDVEDYVGDFSTTLGCVELRKALERRRRQYPDLNEFLQLGASIITPQLVADINNFLSDVRGEEDNKNTLRNLREMLDRSTLAVFITAEEPNGVL